MQVPFEKKVRFCKTVKRLCKEQSLSQEKLAERINVSKSTLTKYLSPKENLFPTQDCIKEIAKHLNVKPELLYYEPKRKTNVFSVQEELSHFLRAITVLDINIEINGDTDSAKHLKDIFESWKKESSNYSSLESKLSIIDSFVSLKNRYFILDRQIISWREFFEKMLKFAYDCEKDDMLNAELDNWPIEKVDNQMIEKALAGFEKFLILLPTQLAQLLNNPNTPEEIRESDVAAKKELVAQLYKKEWKDIQAIADAKKPQREKSLLVLDEEERNDQLHRMSWIDQTPLYYCLHALVYYFNYYQDSNSCIF